MDTEPKDIKESRIREVLEGLQCILTAHESCAELIDFRDNRAVIHCGRPCMQCDNNCIEESIREALPDVEVIIQ